MQRRGGTRIVLYWLPVPGGRSPDPATCSGNGYVVAIERWNGGRAGVALPEFGLTPTVQRETN